MADYSGSTRVALLVAKTEMNLAGSMDMSKAVSLAEHSVAWMDHTTAGSTADNSADSSVVYLEVPRAVQWAGNSVEHWVE